MCLFSHQPGSRLTQQKNTASLCLVLESWSGWGESPVSARVSWREQTDWRKGHCSFSILSCNQFSGSTAPAILEKPFSLFSLSRDYGKSLGKQVFLVLALLNIPHNAYTRIYNSLTKQITELIKVSPWNSRRMNFHSVTTSVSFNFLSFLVPFCSMSKAASHGPAD